MRPGPADHCSCSLHMGTVCAPHAEPNRRARAGLMRHAIQQQSSTPSRGGIVMAMRSDSEACCQHVAGQTAAQSMIQKSAISIAVFTAAHRPQPGCAAPVQHKGVRCLLTRVAQGGGGGGHDGGHQRVGLVHGGGRLIMQALHRDAIQRCVVQHHDRVGVQGQALHGQHGVVGLHHHVAARALVLVGKHAAAEWMRCHISD